MITGPSFLFSGRRRSLSSQIGKRWRATCEICEGPSAGTCAVTQMNHMERSAGDANAIIEEMSEKKTACMWEECMPDNHQSACRTFSPSPRHSSVENREVYNFCLAKLTLKCRSVTLACRKLRQQQNDVSA